MKKNTLLLFSVFISGLLFIISCGTDKEGWYEKTGRENKEDSRFYNAKYAFFPVKPADIYVYSSYKDSVASDLIVTVLRYDSAAKFSYQMTGQTTSGTIDIPVISMRNAVKYDTLPVTGYTELQNQSLIWLSKRNYGEIETSGKTIMDLGDSLETFIRGNTSTLKLNVKGKEKLVTLYNIENIGTKPKKHLAILTDAANPLITKMEGRWSYSLKEVR